MNATRASRVAFDEDAHIYRDARGIIPGVTTLARWASGDRWHGGGAWHADRGRAVHLMVEYEVAGILDEGTVGADLRPFLDAWRRFVDHSRFEVQDREWIVYHAGARIAGRLDLTGWLPGVDSLVILDLKTGGRARWHEVQTRLYRSCVADEDDIEIGAIMHGRLYLTPAGAYHLDLTDPLIDVDDGLWIAEWWWAENPGGPGERGGA